MPAITSLQNFSSITESFTLDGIVILALVAVLFVYIIRYGKEHIISLILALYIALLAFIHFPYKEQFLLFSKTEMQHLVSNTLIFVTFTVIGYLAVSPMLRNRYSSYGNGTWFEGILLSIATVALLIAFSYHVLPIASLYTFGESIATLFAPSQFFFWWLASPLVVLLLVGRR
ncbi:MAG TPA: hypothetical protein VGA06_02410 [Candidatus Paceibacterota bacterium]|jgi:hypothetical protein